MKLASALLATTVSAEWEKPSYWDIYNKVQQRSAEPWGFPAGIRAAADWSNCPQLATPAGAASVSCDGSTCATICMPGYQSAGQRRTRCRWKGSKGFFWKRELGSCFTCDPEEPTVADTNVSLVCSVSAKKNRRVCVGTCPSGANFPGARKDKKVKAKCKCPKRTGVCGWIFKKTSASSFDGLACENVSGDVVTTAAGTTVAVTTVADTTAAVTTVAVTTGAGDTTVAVTTLVGDTTAAVTTVAATTVAATTVATTTVAATTTVDPNAFTIAACEAALTGNANAVEICAAIELQNASRVSHQVDAFVVPDVDLCTGAQEWAQANADANTMEHSDGSVRPGLGENLAMGTALDMSQATTLWQNEDAFWDFSVTSECTGTDNADCLQCANSTPNGNPFDCLHFTQNVWAATTQVCYGKAQGSDGNWYIAARYSPTGNILGTFNANVLPQA